MAPIGSLGRTFWRLYSDINKKKIVIKGPKSNKPKPGSSYFTQLANRQHETGSEICSALPERY